MNQWGIIICFLFTTVLFPSTVLARIPNDPYAEQPAYAFVKAYDAWEYATGSRDVIVAVIDNGFDTFHPDLKENVWKNIDEHCTNGIDDDRNGYVDDCYGWNFFDDTNNPRPDATEQSNSKTIHHATLVAGIIGGVGDNNKGGVGINWQVQLMNLKVLGNKGAGNIGGLPKAIRYAVDNGADVINISLVGGEDNGTSDAIQYAYDHGVFVVAAAGNSRISLNNSPQYPVCADAAVRPKEYVIGVSAVTVERMLAEFSNIGSNCIDITSPGVNIYGPLRFSPTNKLIDLYSSSTPWHGTSFAAPFVSGAAALIKSVQPGWTPDQIFDAMAKTISKTTPKNEEEYQQLFGAGLLQIGPAVAYALGQERTMSTTTPVSFGIFQLDTGRVALDALDYATTQKALRRVDDVTGYYNQDVRWVATSQFNTQTKQVRINIYDEQWILFNTIDIPSEQPLGIRIGNVVGTSEKELIIFPLQQSTMLFSVYDMKGNLIQEKKNTKQHTGVSVEFVPEVSGVHMNMLVSFVNEQGITQIDVYNQQYTRIHTMFVSDFSSIPSVLPVDIDTDKKQEYIVGAGVGDMPYVVIIDDNGEEIRRFLVSKASYLGGIDILMSPQKEGTTQKIWVSKRSGSRIVTAYSLLGKKGSIFYPFSKAIKPSSRMHLRVIR